MAMTLAQQQLLIKDAVKSGVIDIFQEESQVLKYLPFKNINSNAYVYNQEATLPGANFRAVNGSYDQAEGTWSQSTETLVAFGNETKIDRYLTKTQNTNDVRAEQVQMMIKSLALDFDASFLSSNEAGSSATPNSFDGLGYRLGSGQKIDGGGDALTLTELDQLIDAIKGQNPTCIFCDPAMVRKVSNLVRSENQAVETVSNSFGQRLVMYAGVPLVACEEDSSGNPVLNDNTSSPAYTAYAVKFGNDMCVGLQSGGIEMESRKEFPHEIISVEWIVSFILAHPKSAAMLHNFTI
jgi:hypothetical protein